jgi:immunity protein Imm5 of predicted polymorphic toxin system
MSTRLPLDFSRVQAECMALLRASENAILRLSARKRLLRSMGTSQLRPDSNQAIVTQGLKRRTALQIISTEKVLPKWEWKVGTDDPRRMLDLARGYLAGSIDYEEAYCQQHTFGGALLNVDSLPEEDIGIIYVGHAAVAAVLTALMDADLAENEDEDEDDDVYSGEMYACAAFSGDLPWGSLSSAAKRQEFWDWWLTVAAPQAYASVTG